MLWSIPAFACKCNHQDIESSFKSADFVFVANIYSTVNEFPGLQQNNPILLSRAKIVKSYKSPSEFSFYQTKEVTLLSSSLDTCDYPFVAHGKYLIFGFLDSDSEFVYSSHCLSTKVFSELSTAELATLSRLATEYKNASQNSTQVDENLVEIVDWNSNRKMNTLLLENKGLIMENKILKYSLILITVLGLIALFLTMRKK
ncbi:hypothetical protein J8J42_08930 [Chryseobacterium sp. cx-311]|uniref:hypothetical protein n=1 Tax=Marnyiella aurantia TaxID=2758037 RepID=UPI001AE5AF3B|nr:hypothetical protein [Marnyiella aurantia]MBP0613171.1 hypothetical protein [Marnyiella aurantia]